MDKSQNRNSPFTFFTEMAPEFNKIAWEEGMACGPPNLVTVLSQIMASLA